MTERMTAAELQKLQGQKKGKKRVMGAERVSVDGQTFDSKKEARRWYDLKMMEKAGAISNLTRQVSMPLLGKNGPILTPTGKQMRYVADFQYWDMEKCIWVLEDAKGHPTEVFQIKKAILAAQGQELKIT